MTGTITHRRAYITLFVSGMGGQGNVEFTIDTGFTGELTLPPAACEALQLPLMSRRLTYLADGSEITLSVYLLTLLWDGIKREVEVLAIESEPLLGMTFLEGYEVCLQIAENGTVRIKALF